MTASAEERIQELLARHLGLEVKSVGPRVILAAVMTRVAVRATDLVAYAELVASEPAELDALVDEIVVPESWFMRDRVPFTNLAAHARAVLKSRPGRFRVLSVPCSTGEEPYSVVIAMLDAGIAVPDVKVDGVDISPPLLEAARRGVYRAMSFRGEEVGFRARYFHDGPGDGPTPTWVISDAVREAVRFRQGNVLAPGFLANEPAYDAILCRNLLIYLTADARRTALDALERLLGPDGIVVVGHAERLEVMDPRFRALPLTASFTYQRRGRPTLTFDKPVVPRTITAPRLSTPVTGVPVQAPSASRLSTPVAGVPVLPRTVTLPSMSPAGFGAAGEEPPTPAAVPRPPRDLLADATAHADRGELEPAARLCEEHLAQASTDARGWTLLGTIRNAGGQLARAEECFARAVYCDPACYPALVQLALLLDGRGDHAGAANMRRRATKIGDGSR